MDAAARGLWIRTMTRTAATRANNKRLVDRSNVVLFAGNPLLAGPANLAFVPFIVRFKYPLFTSSVTVTTTEPYPYLFAIYHTNIEH